MSLRIIDSEFGAGAGDRLGRIEKMYHRVGSALSQSLYFLLFGRAEVRCFVRF
jgi:hypothetical protein